jgi:hypothetical protein
MKIHCSILSLGLFQALSWGANAFTLQAPKVAPSVVLRSSGPDDVPIMPEELKDAEPVAPAEEFAMYPIKPTYETIQGGGTVRTYQMPDWATRAQMALKTNGRPLRATAQLWIGPIRTTHTMKIDCMNGVESPYMSTLTFKKLAPAIRLITSDSLELPVEASVWVPAPDRAEAIGKNIEKLWNEATRGDQKKLIQGADVSGGDGAVRSWEIPANVKSVQLVAWSKDTSKFSFKCKVEVLQGPNNKKQDIFLQCGGSTQPFHSVLQTPGAGWIIRVFNKKFVEDGRFELAVMPHEMEGDAPKYASTVVEPIKEKKEWWM